MRSLLAGALALGVAATGLLTAAPAKADDHWHGHGHWGHWDHHPHGPVFVPAPPVRYYAVPRYLYAPPPPAIYVPPPPPPYYYAPSGVSLNVAIPLR